MQGNRYDRGWMPSGRYARDYSGRRGPAHGPGTPRGYDATVRRGGYDTHMRGGYDRGWTGSMAYGRAPGIAAPGGAGMTSPGMMGMAPGIGMTPGMFTPFGWDPMMRWSGWDPLAGFVPYQDTPRRWSYGLAQDAMGYDHEYYRGTGAPRGYDRDHRLPPRQSPMYGRGGDRAVREWARAHGYDVDHTIQPRLRGRR